MMRGPTVLLTNAARDAIGLLAHDAGNERREKCAYLIAEKGVIVRIERPGHPEDHASMTRPDRDAAQRVMTTLKEDEYLAGEVHIHFNFAGPSSGDLHTLRTVASDGWSGYLGMVVNITSTGLVLTCHTADRYDNIFEHTIEIVDEREEYDPLIPPERKHLRYVQFGLGTGGGPVAHQSALWGLPQLTFVDHDNLEPRNAARHYATLRDAKRGMKKTRWARSFLAQRTTSAIRTYARQVSPHERAWLRTILRDHDIVAECTGHPVVRQIISEECKAVGRPLVTAGVFAKASGGYVFTQHAHKSAACNTCLFKLTRHSARDDQETVEQLTRDYGFTPEQLERQLGLFTDVSITAILQAKVLLDLIRGVHHDENLYLVDNQALTLRKAFVKQSATCTTCHPEEQ